MTKILGSIITLFVLFGTNRKEIQNPKKLSQKSSKVVFGSGELRVSNLKTVSRVTGKSKPGEQISNPNSSYEKFDIAGTDLGISWSMSDGKTGIFFGDTFGGDWKPESRNTKTSNWRSNVLAFSTDRNLEDGLTFSEMAVTDKGFAKQIIDSEHNTSGLGSFTAIPTAAIRVKGMDYVHYMDVRKWEDPGKWKTNFSALYISENNAQDWQKCSEVIFDSTSNFSQIAYARKGKFVYMLGTLAGRFGSAYLARFIETDILNQNRYDYWNNKIGWVRGSEKTGTPIFDAPVGELSIIYNSYFKRWIATYLNEKKRQIVFRDSPEITGEWSPEKMLVPLSNYPAAYGAFIHPVSQNGRALYFLMSQWEPYNVFLMKAEINSTENKIKN